MSWSAALHAACVAALRAACLAVLWAWLPALGQSQLAVPPLTGHVVDQTGTLSPSQADALEQTLGAFEARKGSQIAVLLVPTTAPEAIEPYALRVAEQWKLGRKKVDDGLILLVAKNDRTVRFEVGYGLEGALPDIVCKRIISETLLAHFRQGDFYGGIDAGLAQAMHVLDGEALPPPAAAPAESAESAQGLRAYAPLLLFLVLALGGVLRGALGRPSGAVLTGSRASWGGGPGLGGGLLGGGYRGGGGGFGGGGASGRW